MFSQADSIGSIKTGCVSLHGSQDADNLGPRPDCKVIEHICRLLQGDWSSLGAVQQQNQLKLQNTKYTERREWNESRRVLVGTLSFSAVLPASQLFSIIFPLLTIVRISLKTISLINMDKTLCLEKPFVYKHCYPYSLFLIHMLS